MASVAVADLNATSSGPLDALPATNEPVIHLEFQFRQVDTVLAVAYGGACFFAFWAFAMHYQAPTRQSATLGFYLLMGLAALTRVVWFATPYGVLSVLVEPTNLRVGDAGWELFLLGEAVELLGSFLLFSIFVLIVVFWADMLRRLFTNGHIRSQPLKRFAIALTSTFVLYIVGFSLFVAGHVDAFGLLTYDDVIQCVVSLVALTAVLVYSFRMTTVLRAFLEVSQIDTTDRIHAVQSATAIGASFLIVNLLFLLYALVSLVAFDAVDVALDPTFYWLVVASKHVVEVLVLYLLLYTLWGKSRDDAESKDGYEPIPEYHTGTGNGAHYVSQAQYVVDEEAALLTTATGTSGGGGGGSTPRR